MVKTILDIVSNIFFRWEREKNRRKIARVEILANKLQKGIDNLYNLK